MSKQRPTVAERLAEMIDDPAAPWVEILKKCIKALPNYSKVRKEAVEFLKDFEAQRVKSKEETK